MSSPAVKDLPTIGTGLKEELEKDHQLKKTSVSKLLLRNIILFCHTLTYLTNEVACLLVGMY